MNSMQSPPSTWVDVARRLACLPLTDDSVPSFVRRARVSWYGITIEGTKDVTDSIVSIWLEHLFPGRVLNDPLRLQIEGPPHAATLEINIEIEDESIKSTPSFGIVDGTVDFHSVSLPTGNRRAVPIVAAISVKGGTGRTTTAVAFALRWAKSMAKPVLLVDADLEAPGISYLFQEVAGEARISFEDLVVLAHSDENYLSSPTVEFVADRLRDHLVPGNLVILPLRRDLGELSSSAIRPEHLSTPQKPFAMADLLAAVANRAGCSGVVIDVRAGLVPIGVNLALDPEVAPVIVTTLSDQALKATAAFSSFISREIRRSGAEPRKPLLVVNRVPSLFAQTGMDKQLIDPLVLEMISSLVPELTTDVPSTVGVFDESSGLEPLSVVQIPEMPDLQVSAAGWERYVQQIENSGFARNIAGEFDQWIRNEVVEISADLRATQPEFLHTIPVSIEDRRRNLSDFAETLVAAENITGHVSKPLVTKPLAALASRFQAEVPIAISEGSKGTGKTLAARFFIEQKTWSTVVEALIDRSGAADATIIGVCASIQSSENLQSQVDASRTDVSKKLNLGQPANVYSTTSWLKSEMPKEKSEADWVSNWLDVIAWSAGFDAHVVGAGPRFLELLRTSNQNAVAIIEGVEEIYSSVLNPGVGSMTRALLVGLPQRLRSEPKRPLGMVAFARRDTVEAAVSQNLDQFRREYASFALTWTDDDVLELAAWLVTQANAMPQLWSSDFGKLSQSEKASKLEQLWGRKLGPDDEPGKRIREAYTATWIVAVLSDLQGRLVPRDLIRLLANAAKEPLRSNEQEEYGGRLLIPRALKSAVEPTSTAKVRETEEEISELQQIFRKFRERAEQVAAPLDRESLDLLGIKETEVDILRRHGIIFGDAPPYEVPELFRRGLSLRHAGARQSVVNLYRRARRKYE